MSITGRLTRRQWTALVASTPLLAQSPVTAPPESATKQAATAAVSGVLATPEAQLTKAIADVRVVSDKLSKIQVPMAVEPSFVFKP